MYYIVPMRYIVVDVRDGCPWGGKFPWLKVYTLIRGYISKHGKNYYKRMWVEQTL